MKISAMGLPLVAAVLLCTGLVTACSDTRNTRSTQPPAKQSTQGVASDSGTFDYKK